MSKRAKTCGNLQASVLSFKKKHNKCQLFRSPGSNFIWICIEWKKGGAKKLSLPKSVSCYILFCLFVFVCMENYFQYLWSSLEWEVPNFPINSFQYEKREFSTTTNFRSVTRTWTVSLCVCRVESGLCLSSYLCMYLCWFVMWKFNNMKWIWAFWLVD